MNNYSKNQLPEVFYKKNTLKNFAKFTEKQTPVPELLF